MKIRRAAFAIVVVAIAVHAVPSVPATAAFPGTNGLLAFESFGPIIDPNDPIVSDKEIVTMPSGGGVYAQLTVNAVQDFGPNWSPDGTKIVFQQRQADTTDEIFVMNADGSNPVRLTTNTTDDLAAEWSPDGKKILFTRDADAGSGLNYDLFIMRAQDTNGDGRGDNVVRLTRKSTTDLAGAWSPNGKWITFTSNRKDDYEIFRMRPQPEGSQNRPRNVTKNAGSDSSPDWSPDSTRIAFVSNRDGGLEIYTMKPDGTDVVQLTNNANATSDGNPSWSPDGTHIAFDRTADIWTMDATDGSPEQNVTNTPARSDVRPDWQPIVP